LIRCLDQGKFDVLTLVTLGRHDQDMCKEDLNNISQMHTLPDAVSNIMYLLFILQLTLLITRFKYIRAFLLR
jgi:hypothetical protein